LDSQEIFPLLETRTLLTCSEQPITLRYPTPVESIPHSHPYLSIFFRNLGLTKEIFKIRDPM